MFRILTVHILQWGAAGILFTMYLKHLTSVLALLFLSLLGVHAQMKPGPDGVVCEVDDSISAATLADQPGWKDPHVQGMLIRQTWASLEPSEGSYDFALLDEACQLARQNNKFIGIALGAGRLSPSWLYRAGARVLPLAAAAGSEPMPVPWDPIFQSAWASTIETLGNRYDTNPALAYVTASGAGRDYTSSLALTNADIDCFNAIDGAIFWKHAAGDIADLYAVSFPQTKVVLPVDAVIPGLLGQKMTDAVAEEQLQSHPSQLELTAGSLATSLSSSFQNVPVGLQVESLNNLATTLDSAAQITSTWPFAFVEINASLSPIQIQAALAQSRKAASTASTATAATLTKSTTATSSTSQKSTKSSSSALSAAQETALCAQITAAAQAAASSGQPIWLSAVAGNTVGTGTQANPLNVPTADRLTAALFPLSNLQVPNLIFHFLPGTFYTDGNSYGWALSPGWQFLGSGQGTTILKIDNTALQYTNGSSFADPFSLVVTNGTGNRVIQDMTLDGNASGCGSSLTDSFIMPAARATVTVKVADSSNFKVGKCVYVQDTVATNGLNLYYALMQVTAITSSTRVTLKNLEVPTPGTITGNLTSGSPVITGVSSIANLDEGQALTGPGIPSGALIASAVSGTVTLNTNATASASHASISYSAVCLPGENTWFCPPGNVAPKTVIPVTAYVLVAVASNGLSAFGNVTVQNLTVQNLGRFSYEWAEGIILDGATNALVQNCTLKNMWGVSGWHLALCSSSNVSLIGNTINGDGYSQGYSLVRDNQNVTISNNTATGVTHGLFSDTGTKTNFTVTGNNFQAKCGIALLGGAFTQSTFSDNVITVTQSCGTGICLVYVDLTSITFTENSIAQQGSITNTSGVNFNSSCTGSTGNVFSNNVIDSSLWNTCGNAAFGLQSENVDQNGNEISLGLQE